MPVLEHTGPLALRIEPGEIVSILGAPASGKTRVALELAFLAKPEEGEVLFHGVNPLKKKRASEMRRPREVTLLVQNAEDQLFAQTVFDDVAFGPRHLDIPEQEIEQRVVRALKAVRLWPDEIRDRSPFALSGGERRRVALAGVLAMEPEVLILDEPSANLDPRTRNAFLELLAPLRGKSAIVWLTVSAREAELADRIVLLDGGRMTEVRGGADLLRNWQALASAGIELPAVYELAGALEQRGLSLAPAGTPGEMTAAIIQGWKGRHDDR
ncbi:MAG: energy-coupling factor ABC transporter ATP-binding protein [Chloroflexota bacterium]|nr:energy-coupling factor ABC transporter ATP-binding protein [Chloroflexota bacterium]